MAGYWTFRRYQWSGSRRRHLESLLRRRAGPNKLMNSRRLLRLDEVVLVQLHEGLHELGWNQPDIVALLVQRPAEEVGAGARLQPDQRGLYVRGVSLQLLL